MKKQGWSFAQTRRSFAVASSKKKKQNFCLSFLPTYIATLLCSELKRLGLSFVVALNLSRRITCNYLKRRKVENKSEKVKALFFFHLSRTTHKNHVLTPFILGKPTDWKHGRFYVPVRFYPSRKVQGTFFSGNALFSASLQHINNFFYKYYSYWCMLVIDA